MVVTSGDGGVTGREHSGGFWDASVFLEQSPDHTAVFNF